MLFVTDPEHVPTPDGLVLMRAYGLTASEADIAVALARGDTLSDIADTRCVSIHTVRAQVKQVLSKTSTRRQSALVRLLLASARP